MQAFLESCANTEYARKKRRSYGPVTFALELMGDKWSVLIVRDVIFRGRNTYGEFLDHRDGIAANVLADRLSLLNNEGIPENNGDPENGRRSIYELTDEGWDLAPILCEMIRWSGKYAPETAVPRELLK